MQNFVKFSFTKLEYILYCETEFRIKNFQCVWALCTHRHTHTHTRARARARFASMKTTFATMVGRMLLSDVTEECRNGLHGS